MTNPPTGLKQPRHGARARNLTNITIWRLAAMWALSLITAFAALPAQAQYATGGSGLHRGRIFWVDFGNNGDNVYAGKTITRGFNLDTPPSASNRLDITCTVSNAVALAGTGNLAVYTPGSWQGDGLDELYNIGGNHPGSGANPNQLSIGLRVSAATIEFDFSCSALLGGAPFPLSGLVFADAEASGGVEYVGARLTNGGTLRIIDSISQCGRVGTVNIIGSSPQEVRFSNPSNSCEGDSNPLRRAGPALVGYIDGALSGRVVARGGGISAVALGAVLELEYSEAIPNSYGIGAHILSANWSGGVATSGVDYTQRGNLATIVYPPPRLGLTVQPDADANGPIGGPDVDALPKTTGPAGNGYANVPGPTARGVPYTVSGINCIGPGVVAGWIDFNGNGVFDASEKSDVVACAAGSNSVALTWAVPAGYVAQPTSFMRLRTASVAAGVANPTGVVTGGETEDYRVTLPSLSADMAVVLSGFAPTPNAASVVTGTATCTNLGPDPAVNPTCTVPTASLPAGATVSCTPNPATNPLPVGAAITCNVSFTAPATGTVVVSASTTTSTPDPVAANNTATQTLTVVPQADMRAATSVPASATAGQPVTVSGTCTNAGPSPAAAPTCALSGLPAGAVQSCTPNPAPNPLAVGDVITCTATFTAPASGPLSITTTAGASTADPVPANNAETKPLPITAVADMSVSLSGFPSNPVAGSTVAGTVTCTNNGPSAAASPTCNVASSPAGATVSCVPNPAPNPLGVGQSIVCSVSYVVPATGGITITATAGSTTTDPNPANNSAQASSQVTAQADMVAATTVPASVTAGQLVSVSGTCTNNGPSPAAAPSCALSGLPAGSPQTCVPSPALSPLAVGQAITCSASFTAPGSGPLAITTTAGTTTADPNSSNNSETKPITVVPSADMAASVAGFPANPAAGSTASGTVTCTNNGPSVAVNASCSVSGLPAGASVSCLPASPAAQLAVGAAMVCSVSYTVPASGSVTVVGTAASQTPDPVAPNNTASATATVSEQADMRASTSVPPSAVAGQSVTVSGVCTNAGPSAAANATCALSGLPIGATQSCLPSPVPNPLTVGQAITCTSTFLAPAGGPLAITTTAGSSTPDPAAANNVNTQPLAVDALADMQAVASGFPATANVGDPVNGTVTCTNNGPSPAANATCAVATIPVGALVVCTPYPAPNPLPVGASITCSVSYTAPSNGAPLTITGVAGSSTADPSPANNTAQATTNVTPQADMVAATTVPASVNAGQPVSVSGTCTNNGPSAAAAPVCALSGLPAGTAQVCVPSPAPDPLAVGGSITCTATFTAPASGPLSISTTAGANTADPQVANNTETKPITVVPQADMQAAFSGFPANPAAGSTVTGQLTCTNNGPSVAANATCAVSGLPAGASLVCSPASPTASLAVGAAIVCDVRYTAPLNGGVVALTGTAGSATADPQPLNNSVASAASVVPQADMQAQLSGLPANPVAGSAVTGTATCTNAGPSAAAAPSCSISGLPAGAIVTCAPSPTPASLAVGASLTCSIAFTAPLTGSVTVLASAASSTADPVPGNNNASQPVAVNPQADMVALLAGFAPNAAAGTRVSGTVTCTNNGPSPADNASCNVGGVPAGATVSCLPNPAPSPLGVGQSIVCSVSYTALAGGAVSVTGRAGSTTADPNPANNTATVTTGVIDATNDTAPAPVNGASGGQAIANVLGNDSINGAAATLANVTLTQTAGTNANVTLDPNTGAVNVAPGTAAGTYTVTYQICTRTLPAACATAVATVVVGAAPIDAVNDPVLTLGPAGGSALLFGNDTLNGVPLAAALVNANLANNGGIAGLTLDATGRLTVPAGTPPGSYTVTYQVCEKLNPTHCDTATVPVVVQGVVSGSIWLDNGGANAAPNSAGNRQRDAGEAGLAGWSVEAVYPPSHPQAGQVVTTLAGAPASAVTDANGSYQIPGLAPGNYQLRFRAPAAAGQGALYGTPVNGEQGNPQSGSVANALARTLDITVPVGGGLAQQSLPVDPSGVVYDAVTRTPVAGAVVTLIGPNGAPVPAAQLLTGQQGQMVVATGPAAGSYRFDLLPTAPAGVYTIAVTAPAGYASPSVLLPPAAVLPFQAGPASFAVVPQAGAPQANQPTTYHLQITLNPAANGADVVHNHIPLDPATLPQLAIDKRANVTSAEVGDLVRYTIRVKNLSATLTLPNVNVTDTLPAGFKLVPNTVRRLGTPPIALADPTGTPGPQLGFALGALTANQVVEFSYHVKLGVGATEGDGTNRAFAQSGALRSLTAQAKVKVGGGVFRTEACFIGKVFMDCGGSVGQGNGNGIQDPGEPGIPGVRIYMEDGTYVVSDSEGKYSYCGATPRTHVLKVDAATLPRGARLGVTSNRNAGDPGSLFIDLKNGELHQADFRDMSCAPAVADEVKRRRDALRAKPAAQDVNAPLVTGDGRTGPGLGLDVKPPTAADVKPPSAADAKPPSASAPQQGARP
jgi:large repetitive protein